MVATDSMASSGSIGSTTSSMTTVSKGYSLFSSSSHSTSVKLDRSNYLLWHYVVLSLIEGNFLESHIDGTEAAPQKLIQKDGESTSLRRTPNLVAFVLVYNEDVLITSNDSTFLKEFTSKLNDTFALKDLGSVYYSLGIEGDRLQLKMVSQ
ncbi:putative mitochondrial protein [Senna tora]|uniref:Putative mitochondrial protein n=1 Tax=Senna tora TaxID=362788 RepID=A0A834SPV4_9FABA|nr:putative mitochondrial protein [Senna tora]